MVPLNRTKLAMPTIYLTPEDKVHRIVMPIIALLVARSNSQLPTAPPVFTVNGYASDRGVHLVYPLQRKRSGELDESFQRLLAAFVFANNPPPQGLYSPLEFSFELPLVGPCEYARNRFDLVVRTPRGVDVSACNAQVERSLYAMTREERTIGWMTFPSTPGAVRPASVPLLHSNNSALGR